MLSQERLQFIKKVIDEGMFVRNIVNVWKGNISFNCHEDDVNYGMGDRVLPASRYKITCTRPLNVKEFNMAKFISKSLKKMSNNYTYRTRYGIFVHNSNADDFFEGITKIRTDMDSLVARMISERKSIIDELKLQYSEVALDMWQRRYGDKGRPPANYVDMMVSRYVDKFPSDESIKRRFRMEVFPVSPIIAGDMPIYSYVDAENHNMKVYRAVYDEIIKRRRRLYYVATGLSEMLSSKEDSGKNIAGAYKHIFLKMREYLTVMFYDEELCQVINSMCDTVSVSDSNRNKNDVVAMLQNVVDIIKSDKILAIHV